MMMTTQILCKLSRMISSLMKKLRMVMVMKVAMMMTTRILCIPLGPSAQQLKENRKIDKDRNKYVEVYTEEGPYWADLWENNRSKYYRMKNQNKNKKGNYHTEMQVEQDERQSLEDATNGDGDNTDFGFITYLTKLITHV